MNFFSYFNENSQNQQTVPMISRLFDGPIFEIPMDDMNFRSETGAVEQMLGAVVRRTAPVRVNLLEAVFIAQEAGFDCCKNSDDEQMRRNHLGLIFLMALFSKKHEEIFKIRFFDT